MVNSILTPRWLHRAVLIPSDRWYKEVDDLCLVFLRQPKGMVPGWNTKQLSAPVSCAGMGLHQLYWANRRRFITTMQQTVRHQHQAFRVSLNKPVDRSQTPFLAYVTLLKLMGAISGISLKHPGRRPVGPSLIDSKDTEDGRMIHNQIAPVGQEGIAHRYWLAKPRWHVLEGRQVPTGYQLTVAGVVKSTPTAMIRRGEHGTRRGVEKAIRRVWGAPEATAVQVSDLTAGHGT